MKTVDKKAKKELITLLDNHKVQVEKMVEVCKKFKIPYLTPAYENVQAVLEQILIDIKKV